MFYIANSHHPESNIDFDTAEFDTRAETRLDGDYPESFFRVCAKAVIHTDDGRILVVQEDGSNWSLPGGGVYNYETPIEGLVRELQEELCVDFGRHFVPRFLGTQSFYNRFRSAWLMWLVFDIKIEPSLEFGVGVDVNAAAIIFPKHLQLDMNKRSELLVQRWFNAAVHAE